MHAPPLPAHTHHKKRATCAGLKHLRGLGWTGVFAINYFIIVSVAVAGFGFGGYASVLALIESINSFGVFAKCFNCCRSLESVAASAMPAGAVGAAAAAELS